MEDPFPDIFKEINETTINLFSNPTDHPVDDFDYPHMVNQSIEDNEVNEDNVYNGIEDIKYGIQETMDNTPSEPKKKDPLFVSKKEETIKKEVVKTDDSEQKMKEQQQQFALVLLNNALI